MRLFIAEDEAPARERLLETIARVAPQARVAGTAASLRETRAWVASNPAPELMLLDIQLADGLSLELFREGGPSCPVIFTTAFDEFVLDAFRAHAIDYLLKPIDEARLAQAFDKFARLQRHFTAGAAGDLAAALALLAAPAAAATRERIVGRKGTQYVAVPLEQVAYFVSDEKLSFMVTTDGRRLLVDSPLADIERDLAATSFFRVNRQYLVSAGAIASFSAGGKGRLELTLQPGADGDVRVSQERAAAFRTWIGR